MGSPIEYGPSDRSHCALNMPASFLYPPAPSFHPAILLLLSSVAFPGVYTARCAVSLAAHLVSPRHVIALFASSLANYRNSFPWFMTFFYFLFCNLRVEECLILSLFYLYIYFGTVDY